MATTEDDDAWLYGGGDNAPSEADDSGVKDNNSLNNENIDSGPSFENKILDREAGELSGDDEQNSQALNNGTENGDLNSTLNDDQPVGIDLSLNEENEDRDGLDISMQEGDQAQEGEGLSEDDDSDDDVQVTIGDIKSLPTYGYGATPVNLNIKRVGGFVGTVGSVGAGKTKGLDLDVVGSINGVPLYDFNLDTMEDKPWRKPGADITDYFNYGFNEDTWKIYCERQRKLRIDNNVTGKVSVNHVVGGKDQAIPIASVNENSKYTAAVIQGLKKAGPPPGRKLSGSIDVIGGGAPSLPSRRPITNTKENVITVMTGRKFDPPPGVPPPHLAPTHLPPPSFLPHEANLSIPPPMPGTIPGLPPTNIPPPPPGTPFADHFASTRYNVPPPVIVGGTTYDEHTYYNESTEHSWTSASPRHRSERERSERGERGDREHRERSREREHERYTSWEYRERDRDRGMSSRSSVVEEDFERHGRHRDYHESRRERDRERERHGERESSTRAWEKDYERDDRYDRDRERRHKEHRSEREDKHRSSRRRHHHDSDEEHDAHRSSRHKHKRSKREKDDETSSNAAASETQEGPDDLKMKSDLD